MPHRANEVLRYCEASVYRSRVQEMKSATYNDSVYKSEPRLLGMDRAIDPDYMWCAMGIHYIFIFLGYNRLHKPDISQEPITLRSFRTNV